MSEYVSSGGSEGLYVPLHELEKFPLWEGQLQKNPFLWEYIA